jgi:hypothetical protein
MTHLAKALVTLQPTVVRSARNLCTFDPVSEYKSVSGMQHSV